ncbi:MAG: sn-glycerol-3-phosphate ABC transporter ATP-binding protein UgpC [Clostridia bacterium]|nr:sn-glycerol-3-phosphate ABC transporter ATP-binding protein UgpC [Clostridia bacterium]
MATVKLTNVKKIYDKNVVAVKEFNLDIADKEFVVFVGPSGCGKSTTLRMIAGLEEISEGTVEIDGVVVNDKQPKDRDIAMVFQNYALYPNLTVFENMAFPLRIKKMKQDEVYKRVTEAAEILGITDYLMRKPKALSGGQRQRVAIGRAMVRDSKVFLMDEPLSNLDAKLRNQMRAEIILLRKKIDSTFIYVTHDQTEAMTLGDRIVIMKDGYIKQVGTPSEVFDRPCNLFVAEFIGAPKMNILDCTVTKEKSGYVAHLYGVDIAIDEERNKILAERETENQDAKLGIRPEHIVLTSKTDKAAIPCTIQVNEMMGSELHLHVVTDDGVEMIVRVPTMDLTESQRQAMIYGTKIYITFDSKAIHLFDAQTEENLVYGKQRKDMETEEVAAEPVKEEPAAEQPEVKVEPAVEPETAPVAEPVVEPVAEESVKEEVAAEPAPAPKKKSTKKK